MAGDRLLLVHGLWMNGPSLIPLAHRLEELGFEVHRHGYASCRHDLDRNTRDLAERLLRLREDGLPVHVLGHSMGGVVGLCACLAAGVPSSGVQRLVMMGSPYQGSHCARQLSRFSWLAPIFGRTLPEWMAHPRPELPSWLEVGTLAGNLPRGLGHVFVPSLPEPHDGVIAVEETRLPGARDAICLPVNHMGMLVSGRCARQAGRFFTNGAFDLAD